MLTLALWPSLVMAISPGLTVEFQNSPLPLFSQTNFMPGESAVAWFKVVNNTAQGQDIAVEAVDYPGYAFGQPRPHDIAANDLSRALFVVISEQNGADLYGGAAGQKTLYDFYQAGEVVIANLDGGSSQTYEIEISFPLEKNNGWQEKTTSFKLAAGFAGTEDQIDSGGGTVSTFSGGGIIQACSITESAIQVSNVGTGSATVSWTTSQATDGSVIYAAASENYNFDLSLPPKYGYAYSISENLQTASHSLVLSGLLPGTAYYFRVSSCAGQALSLEHEFATGAVAGDSAANILEKDYLPPLETNSSSRPPKTSGGQGEVLGESTATPANLTALLGESAGICKPANWRQLGYAALAVLLVLGFLIFRRKNSFYQTLFAAGLFLAAIIWWWFQPCASRSWHIPAISFLIILLVWPFFIATKEIPKTGNQ